MIRKKRFSISSDITQGISDVINAVNQNAGKFRYEVVALSRIEIDPQNPRELTITPNDILQGLQQNDPAYALKESEYKQLNTLSRTIKEKGVINPIVLYRHNDRYRIIAGERRYLASLMAKNADIHARIMNGTPSELDIKILQWVENNERQDLSLHERIGNVDAILTAYKNEHPTEKITINLLQEMTGLAKSQASKYLVLINAQRDVLDAIKGRQVANLDKALLIANVKDRDLRQKLIEACEQGSDLSNLNAMLEQAKRNKKTASKQKARGRPSRYIHLGKVQDTHVVKKIMDLVLAHDAYQQHANVFHSIDWNDPDVVTKAFAKLLDLLGSESRSEK